MGIWSPSTWTWRGAADVADTSAAVLAAMFGGCATIAAPEWKGWFALPATLCAVTSVLAKMVVRRIDSAEAEEVRRKKATLATCIMKVVMKHIHDDEFFEKIGDTEKHLHRVTLFVYVDGAKGNGRGSHLSIYARSGVELDSKTIWPVDDNNPERCRGIAGKIWYHGVADFRVAECDWPGTDERDQKEAYAASLEATVAEVESVQVKARSFCGIPINVSGKKWGVLLLDSKRVDGIKKAPRKEKRLRRLADVVGALLAEVGV